MAKFRTHYDNLGVARNADPAVIKAAYKALAQKYHPDKNPNNPNVQKVMQIINKAYEVLSDPIRRAEHDRWIDEQERQNRQNNQKQATQQAFSQENDDKYHRYDNKSMNKDNASQDNDSNESNGSWFGTWFMPFFVTLVLSKFLLSVGVFLGLIGLILSCFVYSIFYFYTYDFIKLHKIFKEFFAIISGIIGIIIFVFTLLFISDIFYKKPKNNISNDNNKDTYQKTQLNNTLNDIKIPTVNNEPKLNPKIILAETKNRYDNAVANINSVWNSLHPSTQEFLRAEQRAINKKREADCTAYGNAQSTDKDLAMAYRYLCEVPQLNERAQYLKTQLNTVVTPPKPDNVGPAYYQNQQSKDEFVLSQMMNVYNNPQSAPPVHLCQGDIYCNAFLALSQYWVYIPDSYRYQGDFNIKYQAQIGDAYGLNKGFTLNKEQSILLSEGGNLSNVSSGGNAEQEKTFAEGLAVLLYIEDMNGWL